MREKHYVERDGKIYALVSYTDSTGKRRQIWRLAESKSHAKEIARELKEKLRGGTEPFEHKGTLNEYLDKWLATSKQSVAVTTYSGYVGLMRLYIRPTLGEKKLSSIKPLDIQEVVNGMIKRGLSSRTVRYTIAILYRALKQAMKWKVLSTNPAADVQLPKKERKEMKALSPSQAKAFLAECEKSKHGLLLEFQLLTGMRPGECLGLQWLDIDFERGLVTIQRSLIWNQWETTWELKETKTATSRRSIPLPLYLVQRLSEHKRGQLEQRMKAGEKWNAYNLVFCSSEGKPLAIRNLRRRFKDVLKRACLEKLRLYDLCHSCATLLLAAGENPKVVSERLGHASIVLTLDTYSHVLPSMQKSATDKLEGILKR